MHTLSLAAKLRIMAVGAATVMLAIATYSAAAFYQTALDLRLANTRTFVQSAVRIAEAQATKVRSGSLTVAQAQAQAAAEIGKLRYDGGEYVWINDMHPRMVMHPIKPDMNGQDLSAYADPQGKRLFVAFVETVRREREGLVDYLWPKPGKETPEPKRSYVAGFAEWNWVLGSGVYVGEVRQAALRFAAMSFGLGAAGSLAVGLFAVLATRSLRRRLSVVDQSLQSIASGDLTFEVDTSAEDDIGQLMRSVGKARDGLCHLVREVQSSTECIASASSEIAAGSNDLSHRTEQTSSQLQGSAGAMAQLTSGVQHSAELADLARTQAASATTAATQGGGVVGEVVQTMEQISASSRKIADIIGVIDGIAFQTNILALNAAVESARAGEHGRGFAVVASEVRSLAQRSAEAAREIKQLIGSSVERVDAGSRLVVEAGQSMQRIVASVQQVTTMVDEIAQSSQGQSRGLADVNASVGELDHMTQQNAALVEQSAASAEALRDQSTRLSDLVRTFRLA